MGCCIHFLVFVKKCTVLYTEFLRLPLKKVPKRKKNYLQSAFRSTAKTSAKNPNFSLQSPHFTPDMPDHQEAYYALEHICIKIHTLENAAIATPFHFFFQNQFISPELSHGSEWSSNENTYHMFLLNVCGIALIEQRGP